MKRLKEKFTLFIIMLIIFSLIILTQISMPVTSNLEANNGRIVKVAVIVHRFNDPYTGRIRESLENIGSNKENKVKFDFFEAKDNIAIQNEIIDSALKNNYDLFILNLADKRENIVEDILYKFREKSIPVIIMNIAPEVVQKVSTIYNKAAFVLPDSKKAGTEQGKILIELWNTNKAVIDKNGDNELQYVLLEGRANDPQTLDRSSYVISTINDSGIKTEQLAVINANWLADLAEDSIDNLLLKYGGSIEAIISNNDAMAIGAIKALQNYGYNKGDKSKYMDVVGIDGLPEAKELIDKGFMTGTVIQEPDIAAKMFYAIGMNLINNLDPIENTNYQKNNGEIIVPYSYSPYIAKFNDK